jgi:hypothetical protein
MHALHFLLVEVSLELIGVIGQAVEPIDTKALYFLLIIIVELFSTAALVEQLSLSFYSHSIFINSLVGKINSKVADGWRHL